MEPTAFPVADINRLKPSKHGQSAYQALPQCWIGVLAVSLYMAGGIMDVPQPGNPTANQAIAIEDLQGGVRINQPQAFRNFGGAR